MLLNSVHEQCPNSDPKQCTVTKLGWVHCAHTQNLGRRILRAQCPCRGRCCAHSKLVALMSRAQPAQVTRMLGVHLSRHAQAACPQVATSLRCRDIKATRIMSRHQIDVATPLRTLQVATSKRGRDTKPPIANPPRSRRPLLVATSR